MTDLERHAAALLPAPRPCSHCLDAGIPRLRGWDSPFLEERRR